MSLFRELHEKTQFDSVRQYEEFRLHLQQAIERGFAKEMKPVRTNPLSEEYWYRDTETGDVYTLTPPDFPARGNWAQVDLFERLGDECFGAKEN